MVLLKTNAQAYGNVLNGRRLGNAESRELNMSKLYIKGKEDDFAFMQLCHFDRKVIFNHRDF